MREILVVKSVGLGGGLNKRWIKKGLSKKIARCWAGSWMAVETVPVEEVVEEDQSDSHVWWTKSEEPLS